MEDLRTLFADLIIENRVFSSPKSLKQKKTNEIKIFDLYLKFYNTVLLSSNGDRDVVYHVKSCHLSCHLSYRRTCTVPPITRETTAACNMHVRVDFQQ